MGVIRKLSPELVNQIAAGEVIERPASALKELVENSLDAGAHRVDVGLEDGGRRLVRVTDDGCGIAAEDLPHAVASHATSKLASLDDLFRIRTLGFRGEALASMGSISELRVTSCTASGAGHEIDLRGGVASELRPAGHARGTTVLVRNLFYNTPARRKFLRDGPGELRACVEALSRLALGAPGVAFRLAHEGRLVLDAEAATAPTREEALLARVADLYGRELGGDLVPVSGARGAIRVGGFAALPRRTRGDASQQHVTLGGRPIRDRLIAGAIREAYAGLLMTRRFPIVFLDIEADPESVDVNVHPAKLEVRFREPREVFPLVVQAIRSALEARVREGGEAPPAAGTPDPPRASVERSWIFSERPRSATFFRADSHAVPARASAPADLAPACAGSTTVALDPVGESVPVPVDAQGSLFSAGLPAPARHLELASGYLLVETPEGFEVLDPHALHERILYEEIRSRIEAGATEMQSLLAPIVVELSALEEARLATLAPALAELGLVVEPFGPGTAAVQAVPVLLDRPGRDFGALLRDLIGEPDDGARPTRGALVDHLTATLACKAAVKLGERLRPEEVGALLARRALAARSQLCPHGRPTALGFTERDLERMFKR